MGLNLLEGWQQLIYLLIPPYCILTYVSPFEPTVATAALVLSVPVVLYFLLVFARGGYVRLVRSQVLIIGRMFVLLAATQGLFGKKMGWQVSLKNVLGRVNAGALVPHLLILLASAAALVFASLRISRMIPSDTVPFGGIALFTVASGWMVFNMWRSWRWILDTVQSTRRTHLEYRFEVRLPILDEDDNWLGTTVRLSTEDCEVEWEPRTIVRSGQAVVFVMPGFRAKVRISSAEYDGSWRFEYVDGVSADLLRRALYSVDWHRLLRLAKDSILARRQGLGGEWLPALILSDGSACRWAAVLTVAKSRFRVVSTEQLSVGSEVTLAFTQSQAPVRLTGCVESVISPEYPIPRCLNDQSYYIVELVAADGTGPE